MNRTPKLCDLVIYYPRVPYGRQSILAGLITQVHNAESGDVDLVVFSASNEPQRISHAMRKSESVIVNSWEFTGLAADVERLEGEIAELRALTTIPRANERPKIAAKG